MSISASYSSSYYTNMPSMAPSQAQQAKFKQTQQDFQSLSTDLSSGNLSAAKSVFAQIQQNMPQPPSGTSGSSTSGSSTSNTGASSLQTTIGNDMSSLSQALSSGNLSEAQSAYSQLQSDLPKPPSGANGPPPSQGAGHAGGQNAFSSAISSLASSLSSNDIDGAKSAFSKLQQLFQQNSNGNQATNAYSQNANSLLSSLGLNSTSSLQVTA